MRTALRGGGAGPADTCHWRECQGGAGSLRPTRPLDKNDDARARARTNQSPAAAACAQSLHDTDIEEARGDRVHRVQSAARPAAPNQRAFGRAERGKNKNKQKLNPIPTRSFTFTRLSPRLSRPGCTLLTPWARRFRFDLSFSVPPLAVDGWRHRTPCGSVHLNCGVWIPFLSSRLEHEPCASGRGWVGEIGAAH